MATKNNPRHSKGEPGSNGIRSKSQTIVEIRPTMKTAQPPPPPSSPPTTVHPLKIYFENLLYSTPHRFTSVANVGANRRKISPTSSVTAPSDRSSHGKPGHISAVSYYSTRSTVAPSLHEEPPLPSKLLLKFRQAGKIILFSIYWCKFAQKKNQQRSMIYQSYLQTGTTTEKYLFDKSNFKIQAHAILPRVKAFFQQSPKERDIANAKEIRQSLADIKPFTRLPKHLQNQLLQQATYQSYAEKRTIVRQGERCACFYIVLSGSAIPTYKRATDGNNETLDVLTRGCTFGEKGLMTDSAQNFTVTTKTQIELLVLWKDDFKAIYMSNSRHCSNDNLEFLKNRVPILNGFPIDLLSEVPNAIQHCHFRQSEVISKDSRRMKHIFVVKKGSLDIWKRLDPNECIKKVGKENSTSIEDEPIIDDDVEETGDNRMLFSEIQLSGDIDESVSNMNALDTDFRLSRLRRTSIEDQRTSSALSTTSRIAVNDIKKFPGLVDKRDRLLLIDYDTLSVTSNKTKSTSTNSPPKQKRTSVKTPPKPKLIYPNSMVMVHVKTLNEGQHFGLTDMLFPNQPLLTLVSNECECLLINKSSFINLASDQYKQSIRRNEIPFPNDTAFYKTYHTNEIWKRFSKQAYLDAYKRIQQQHPQHMQRAVNLSLERKHYRQQKPMLMGAA